MKTILTALLLINFATSNMLLSQNVGISEDGSNPNQLLHLHEDGSTGKGVKITNSTTGNSASDGVDLINSGNDFQINQLENARIIISTNGFERMTILGNGNVGIGTTGPTQKLDINGAARLRGHLYDYNNSSGAIGEILTRTANGLGWQAAGTDDQDLSVGAGSATTSIIQMESGSDVTLVEGANIALTESGSNITIAVENITSEIGICEFLLSEVVANGGEEVAFVIPANLNGKTLVAGAARGFVGAGTCTVTVKRNGVSVGSMTSVGTTFKTAAGWSTVVSTGDLITVATTAISGTLNGLTVTVTAQ